MKYLCHSWMEDELWQSRIALTEQISRIPDDLCEKRLILMDEVLSDMLVDFIPRIRSRAPLLRGNSNYLVILGGSA